MLEAKYVDIKTLNARYGKDYKAFQDVPVFVGSIDEARQRAEGQFKTIADFNARFKTSYASFDELPLDENVPNSAGGIGLGRFPDWMQGSITQSSSCPEKSLEMYSVNSFSGRPGQANTATLPRQTRRWVQIGRTSRTSECPSVTFICPTSTTISAP